MQIIFLAAPDNFCVMYVHYACMQSDKTPRRAYFVIALEDDFISKTALTYEGVLTFMIVNCQKCSPPYHMM